MIHILCPRSQRKHFSVKTKLPTYPFQIFHPDLKGNLLTEYINNEIMNHFPECIVSCKLHRSQIWMTVLIGSERINININTNIKSSLPSQIVVCIVNINISHCVLNNNHIWNEDEWTKENIKRRKAFSEEGLWNDEKELQTKIDCVTTFFEVLCDKLMKKKKVFWST